jgi:hypothetical protein
MSKWIEAMEVLTKTEMERLVCWLYGYSGLSEIEFIAFCKNISGEEE